MYFVSKQLFLNDYKIWKCGTNYIIEIIIFASTKNDFEIIT